MINRPFLSKLTYRLPMGLVFPVLIIVFIGIINLSSAAKASRPDLYLNQLSKFLFATVLLMVCAFVNTRVIRRFIPLIYLGATFLLLLVLVWGTSVKGSQRWLVFGGFRLQPSDPAKVAIILATADYCARYWPFKGYTLRGLMKPLNVSRPLGLFFLVILLLIKSRHGSDLLSQEILKSPVSMLLASMALLVWVGWLLLAVRKLLMSTFDFTQIIAPVDVPFIPFALIFLEPDLGTGILVLSISAIMFLYVGIRRSSLLLGIVCGVFFAVFSYFTLLKDYQKQRLISFLNQDSDVYGQGYQAMQSIIAIGSGGIIGKGYNGGTQTQLSFLPENATDFVFSVWGEEWGFLACIFLLAMYFVIIATCFRQCVKNPDRFSQLVLVGTGANLFIHVLVNVAMVTGMMPVVGVPLPLMSYGGSSLTVTMISLGLAMNVCLWRKVR